MASHVGIMMLFAGFVSVVFSQLMREAPRDQLRVAAKIFAGLVGGAVLLGWLMYPFPL